MPTLGLRREEARNIHDDVGCCGGEAFEGGVCAKADGEVAVEGSARLVVRSRHGWLCRVARPERQVTVRRHVKSRDITDQSSRSGRQVRAGDLRVLGVDRASGHRCIGRVASRLTGSCVQQPQRRSERVE